jgi:secondary thiamine-phosphate synthase enzyme
MILQKEITLPEFCQGMHLITNTITASLDSLPTQGIVHLFLKHTSAGLTINENADPTVGVDMNNFISRLIPENFNFVHTMEGKDDMPAHIKSSIFGQSLTIPVVNGKLGLGTWQGIFLYEFRKRGGNRKVIITVYS